MVKKKRKTKTRKFRDATVAMEVAVWTVRRYLHGVYEDGVQMIETVRGAKATDPQWYVGCHHCFGMDIRNLLRKNGISPRELDVDSLDDMWQDIVEEAILTDEELVLQAAENTDLKGVMEKLQRDVWRFEQIRDYCNGALKEAVEQLVKGGGKKRCVQCLGDFQRTARRIRESLPPPKV